MQKKDLKKLRREIDVVDRVILAALAKRKKLEWAVGLYKRKHGMKLLDTKRRGEMLKTRIAQGKTKRIQPELVRKLFTLIHRYSLSTQKKT